MSTYKPIRFIEEPVEVLYDAPPYWKKSPVLQMQFYGADLHTALWR
jgi:hypothetical protein